MKNIIFGNFLNILITNNSYIIIKINFLYKYFFRKTFQIFNKLIYHHENKIHITLIKTKYTYNYFYIKKINNLNSLVH